MSKRIIAVLTVLVLCLSLIPVSVLGAEEDVIYTDTRGNQIKIPGGEKSCAARVISFTQGNPWTNDPLDMETSEILGAPDRGKAKNGKALTLGAGGVIVLEFDILIYDGEGLDVYVFEVGEDVEATKVEVSSDLKTWHYIGDADGSLCGVDMNGKVPEGAKFKYVRLTDLRTQPSGGFPGADIDAVCGLCTKVPASGSQWANEELEKADLMGLIPECLENADLTKPITRTEFAAVCVKLYEELSGEKAEPIAINPFTDCSNAEVLKAYNIGAVNGITATTYKPNDLLNREQAAAMLTRVYKRVSLSGWTLDTDSKFSLDYTMPQAFADDKKISGYARDSVYFMAAKEIIKGIGNNNFAPKNITDREKAAGYANAARQHALLYAIRMVENLDK